MPKIIKLSLKLLLLLIAIVLVALLRLDINNFRPSIDNQIIQIANSNQLRFNFARSDYSLGKISFTSASVAPRTWPIAIELKTLHIVPTWFNFLTLNPALHIDAEAYDGSVTGTLGYSTKTASSRLVGKADELKLERFLPLYSLGITGKAALNITSLEFNSSQLQQAQIDLRIEKANKSNKTSFSLRPWALPFSIEIPAFENLDLRTSFQFEGPKANITALSLSSSLFRLNLNGIIAPQDLLLLKGDVTFSQTGIDQLGQTLQLIVGERQLVADKLFSLEVRAGLGYPQITLKD